MCFSCAQCERWCHVLSCTVGLTGELKRMDGLLFQALHLTDVRALGLYWDGRLAFPFYPEAQWMLPDA